MADVGGKRKNGVEGKGIGECLIVGRWWGRGRAKKWNASSRGRIVPGHIAKVCDPYILRWLLFSIEWYAACIMTRRLLKTDSYPESKYVLYFIRVSSIQQYFSFIWVLCGVMLPAEAKSVVERYLVRSRNLHMVTGQVHCIEGLVVCRRITCRIREWLKLTQWLLTISSVRYSWNHL